MASKRIYLCGPITGTTYNECAMGWRKAVYDALTPMGIEVYSPMRGKDHLSGESIMSPQAYEKHPISTVQAILGRDRADVIKSDMIFANLIGATEKSTGSLVEFGWADLKRIPILICMEPEGNPHEHVFVRGLATWRVHNLRDGIAIARVFMIPGI